MHICEPKAAAAGAIGEDACEVAQLRLARQAMAQLRESVVITDADIERPGPYIVWVNEAFTRMTGYTAEEVMGKSPRFLQGPKTRRETLERLRRSLERGESFTGKDINYRKDGSEFHIDWYIEPLRNEFGTLTHFVAVQRDWTAEHELRQQLLKAQRLESIGMLASGIAHDLNNILAPVLMGSEFLRERLKGAEERVFLSLMQKSAARGAGLVKQILSFAKGVKSGTAQAQAQHLIEDVVALAGRTFPKRISVRSSIAAGLWPVLGDATQFHQVLMNFCVNARDAIEGEGTILVEAANLEVTQRQLIRGATLKPGRYLQVRVSDTGSGIPEEALTKIFQPFYTTKEPGKGTGLGLSTVLAIVESQDGLLDLTTKLGSGTTFTIYLPAGLAMSTGGEQAAAAEAENGRGETVLVVDDEVAILGITREMLLAFGYRVLTAASGAEALRIFQEQQPSLTLLDLMMGDGDGRSALNGIRALDPGAKVVVVSGLSREEIQAIAPDANGMLSKPFSVQDLLGTVSKMLATT